MAAVHVILVTHTPDRIRRTILGIACQSRVPDSVTLTCDSDDTAIRDAAAMASDEFGQSLTLIRRTSAGTSRAAQVRNNAVRELIAQGANDDDALIFFDGDCVPEVHAAAKHERTLTAGELVIGWRYDLTPEQDASFDEDALRAGMFPVTPTPDQVEALARRRLRFNRQAKLRRVFSGRLGKSHKPKLITANCSTTLGVYRAVNGLDETYEGWGQEDDDFARRVYQHGGRPVVAVGEIHTFHQYHPSRAPRDWQDGPNAGRLAECVPTRCTHGLENSSPQAPVTVEYLGAKTG